MTTQTGKVRTRIVRKKIGAERIADGALLTFIWAPLINLAGGVLLAGALLAATHRSDMTTSLTVISYVTLGIGICVALTGAWRMIDGWRTFGGTLERAARRAVQAAPSASGGPTAP
ncbi:hypothetical protein [Demequina subtropica]|uniref:hypothetical protein n=1 Tax=Demequina subtropica TaxID=1638989 RepID=UPI0007837934|nr:hypothetical protein [Demequina subtropica]